MVEGAGGVSGREDLENPSRPPSPANGRSRFGSLAVTVGPHAGKVSVRLPELRLSTLLVLRPPAPAPRGFPRPARSPFRGTDGDAALSASTLNVAIGRRGYPRLTASLRSSAWTQ